jgi:predicted RNA-binding Zn-ribbon protein involved in translation (DUF1610 family)
MNDEILKKLERRLDRRSFLRGSGLAAAGFLGVAAASTLVVFAQAQDKGQDGKKKDDPDRKAEKDQSTDKAGDGDKTEEKDASKPSRTEAPDGTFRDRDGVVVRECPECGHNMYQQGRTWTCENCGYSYVE